MKGVGLRRHTFMFLVAFLVWSSSIETCIARKSKHWRQRRHAASVSLYKKKTKDHGHGHHNYHNGGTKTKPPPYKTTPPSPKVKAPPSPKPKVKVPSIPPPQKGYGNGQQSKVFDVLHFGAKGDGKADDTKAFQAAWAAACKVEASTVVVPAKFIFLVGPISFSGPYCQANIVFQLDGTIIAPTDSKPWGKGILQWLEFTKLKGITVQGKGIIDGRGSGWWLEAPYEDPYDGERKLIIPLNNTVQERPPMPVRNELSGKMPSIKPTIRYVYFYPNMLGRGYFKNEESLSFLSKFCPEAGDDCVSIQTGCSNVYIHNVNCGPGHGISIGSLGKDNTKACVSNITVRDIMMHNTMNGVRIKTWQGGSGNVQGVLFSNIQVSEVQLPIVIDQFYCDKRTCKNQTAAVALSGITYEKIRGTYTVKPVHLACSDSLPCIGVTLSAIQLKPMQERYHLYDPFCWQSYGELTTPTVPPIACLQIGKPPNNRVQSNYDVC
ncbi:hypothetical protein GOBAR_DD25424 [Gossypium barbadense]|nr:hypothetical protein GOBAR_DD25424 [Gossypium barbadense]